MSEIHLGRSEIDLELDLNHEVEMEDVHAVCPQRRSDNMSELRNCHSYSSTHHRYL